MKKIMIILLAGTFFLTLPVIASAQGRHDGGCYDRDRDGYKVWVEKDRGHHKAAAWKKAKIRHHKHKKHLRRELRETRQELRHTKRALRHERRHHDRYYANSRVYYSWPPIVLSFDW